MMRKLLILLLLSGCAASGPGLADREAAQFQRELEGRVAGEAVSCVSALPNQTLQIVDPQTLMLGSGRTIWVNRLNAPCPGMRPLETLIVEVQGANYCRGDRVRALPRGSTIPGPICPLGDFVPYRRPG